MRILLIEDNIKLCEFLTYQLEEAGLLVDVCHDGADGLELIKRRSHDIVLLDRMLPSLNGMEVLKQARSLNISTPIMLVTALGELPDKVSGLELGADDYIVKPFAFEELLARIHCIVRRPSVWSDDKTVAAGDLNYNVSLKQLEHKNKTLVLSKREGALLELFLRNPNQTLPREMILSRVWGPDGEVEDGNLDNYIFFVRRRLKSIQSRMTLKTIRGVGYCLEDNHV